VTCGVDPSARVWIAESRDPLPAIDEAIKGFQNVYAEQYAERERIAKYGLPGRLSDQELAELIATKSPSGD